MGRADDIVEGTFGQDPRKLSDSGLKRRGEEIARAWDSRWTSPDGRRALAHELDLVTREMEIRNMKAELAHLKREREKLKRG